MHFASFTAESMAAFRQALDAGHRGRREALGKTREATLAILDEARRMREQSAREIQEQAKADANSRQTFMNALRSQVATMKDTFQAKRMETQFDLLVAASEFKEAQEAFHGKSSFPQGKKNRGSAR
jgi:di/tripeptidase